VQTKPPTKREDTEEPEESLGAIPELMRRAIALGLTGFFTTEEAVRKAIGDTVPKDWTDTLAESSDRTRSEFLDKLSREIAQTLKDVDLAAVLQRLLEGQTLTVNAEIRLGDDSGSGRKTTVRLEKKIDAEQS
jgi:hypothetical protein